MAKLKPIKKADLFPKFRSQITVQDYSPKEKIAGVQVQELKSFVSEDGLFAEIARLNKSGHHEILKEFKPLQMNYSEAAPGTIRAWHLHFAQEDLWFLPPKQSIIVGLYDIRQDSPTKKVVMRLALGGKSYLVYIPRGVAHGYANLSQKTARIIYLVNQQFDPSAPDERRLPWDILGEDFWQISKG